MGVHALSVLAMAVVAFCASASHFLVFVRARDRRHDFAFAVNCFWVAAYNVFCAGLYSSSTPEQGVIWQRLQLGTIAALSTSFLWFTAEYASIRLSRFSRGMVICVLTLGFISVVDPSGFSWTDTPAVKHIQLPWIEFSIVVQEMAPGPVVQAVSVLSLWMFVITFCIGVRLYRDGKLRKAFPLLLAVGLFFLTAVNDALVNSGVYESLYLIEFGFVGMMLFMVYALSDELVFALHVRKALVESEEKLRRVVDNLVGSFVYRHDRNGNFVYVSQSIADVLGYSPEDFLVHFTEHFTDDLVNEKAREHTALSIQGIPQPPYELQTLHADGTPHWLEVAEVPVRDGSGAVVAVEGIAHDVTDRKEAEEALRAERDRLEALMDGLGAIGIGIDIVGVDYTVLAQNNVLRDRFGEPSGIPCHKYYMAFDEPCDFCPMVKALESGRLERVELKAADGLYYELLSAPFPNPDGSVDKAIEVVVDITDRKKAEEQLRRHQEHLEELVSERTSELHTRTEQLAKAKEAAEAASRAKSEFLSNMSHELRTPLNAILGFSQVLARGKDVTSSQREKLSTINRSGEHLLALINDILEMSKIEAGGTILEESNVDLHGMLDTLESMFRLRAGSKGLSMAFELAKETPRNVRTDERKLRQVLVNLLSNAIKFTETGGVYVRVAYAASDDRLRVDVEDTGPGIAPDEMAAAFSAFGQTAEGRRSHEGTGLGLSISQRFVRLMGGELTATSKVGKGSVFSFDVYAPIAERATMSPRARRHRIIGLAPGQPSPRVLVVEDQQESRELMIQLLSEVGITVRTARDGREAVQLWEEWKPRLIWMDMNMPVMDGLEATRLIKGSEQGAETVIIALTASAFEEDRQMILAAGCDDFVSKPFHEAEIFERMAEHLDLEYVYENEPADKLDTVGAPALSAEFLSELAPEMVSQLGHYAEIGAIAEVERLTSEIEAEHPQLAQTLSQLTAGYNLEIIRAAAKDSEEASERA